MIGQKVNPSVPYQTCANAGKKYRVSILQITNLIIIPIVRYKLTIILMETILESILLTPHQSPSALNLKCS